MSFPIVLTNGFPPEVKVAKGEGCVLRKNSWLPLQKSGHISGHFQLKNLEKITFDAMLVWGAV